MTRLSFLELREFEFFQNKDLILLQTAIRQGRLNPYCHKKIRKKQKIKLSRARLPQAVSPLAIEEDLTRSQGDWGENNFSDLDRSQPLNLQQSQLLRSNNPETAILQVKSRQARLPRQSNKWNSKKTKNHRKARVQF